MCRLALVFPCCETSTRRRLDENCHPGCAPAKPVLAPAPGWSCANCLWIKHLQTATGLPLPGSTTVTVQQSQHQDCPATRSLRQNFFHRLPRVPVKTPLRCTSPHCTFRRLLKPRARLLASDRPNSAVPVNKCRRNFFCKAWLSQLGQSWL